ncbi:hypothetical protein OG607_40950 [Streptomyces sp. NBC_01537]
MARARWAGRDDAALAEALHRDASVLLAAYRSGTWVPALAEREFSDD